MLKWDYTALAESYADRPGYSEEALDAITAITSSDFGTMACDIGAGTGHLAVPLAARGLQVAAVEPNEAMRRIGIDRTRNNQRVVWSEGTAEETGLTSNSFNLVSFGSSFNVVNQTRALTEARRLLLPDGWFVCLWNFRDLGDPLQAKIQELIEAKVTNFDLGARRSDQKEILRKSDFFREPLLLEARHIWPVDRDQWVNAWFSHATLQRQAGSQFKDIVRSIGDLLAESSETISIPYTTRAYLAAAR